MPLNALLFICSLVGFITYAQAQEDDPARTYPETRAQQAINSLKEGVLIVRFSSDARKIEAIERLLRSGNITDKDEERLQERLATTLKERDERIRSMRDAMDAMYGFSDVLYMYDTSQVHLDDGQESGIFLDDEGKVDSSLHLDGRPYLIMYYGYTNRDRTSGIESWIIMDKDLNDLSSPFPYYVRAKGIGARVSKLEGRHLDTAYLNRIEVSRLKGFDRIAYKLDKNLRSFYRSVGGR